MKGIIEYSPGTNRKVSKSYIYKGKLHNKTKPAYIEYYPNGKIFSESWFINGKRHRDNGPAYIEYDDDGEMLEIWYKDGNIYRSNGPAIVEYDDTGIIFTTEMNDESTGTLDL